MKRVLVVIRHLPGCMPVASAIILLDESLDFPEKQALERAKDHEEKFKRKFPEFENANWYSNTVEMP